MTRQTPIHSAPHLLRLFIAFAVALVLPVAVGGAATADGGNSSRTWTVQVGSESQDQAIQGMSFLPENIYVNAGDKVIWRANSAEIHTVTFLAAGQSLESTQPFDPGRPENITQMGGKDYDGHSYYNSGIMTNVSDTEFTQVRKYTLGFPDEGDFTYYCLVHGMAMKGTVHVRAAGTDYPFSQSQYDRKAEKQERAILRDGYRQWDDARDLADEHTVIAGTDNGTSMVMRFVQQKIEVRVGESVTFVNNGMGAPHTVTFGKEPANFAAPAGDPAHYGGGDLNSGIMPPHSSYTVTFTKAGEFDYICALHDFMGMVGTVEVRD
ncbi:plastocyanin/azurin family copper-binding protein [Arthrobacter sp. B3I4]|uniref:plastocyanin/azurin family copper-binding protein n=1 Tax=Arthrobacter sp. B3I4 TaxID=3042267 RepID=UPI0027897923|nr:plastocyanin/azurin family copper-binding protein [Arthrobacter sp. B3I4]MDQ0754408.1 plastocyanin [Arthrobacter sp. B3I4]